MFGRLKREIQMISAYRNGFLFLESTMASIIIYLN
jgi:hypothetical protein